MPPGSLMARIRRRGRLIAGVDQNTLLFGYLRPSTARIEGFEVDLVREIARAILGDPNAIELKALTTAQRLPAVQVRRRGHRGRRGDDHLPAAPPGCVLDGLLRRGAAGPRAQRLSRARSGRPWSSGACVRPRRSTSLQRVESDPAKPVPFAVPQRTDCLVALQEGRVAAITS